MTTAADRSPLASPASRPGAAPRVVALVGTYHHHGTIDRTVAELLDGAREAGAEVERIDLVDRHVEFCRNCRACTQEPGEERGHCVIDDDAAEILDRLEGADGLVLAASTNCGDVNAMTRALYERMIGLAYWPWDAPAPKARHRGRTKPAVLVTSSAAPAPLTRLFARSLKTLRGMAMLLGARPVGRLVVGLAGGREPGPSPRAARRARALGRRLAQRSGARRS